MDECAAFRIDCYKAVWVPWVATAVATDAKVTLSLARDSKVMKGGIFPEK